MQVEITEAQKAELLDAVAFAREKAEEGSTDAEIDALQDALGFALELLELTEPGDDEPEVDPDLHRKQLAEDPEVPC
jgi:hypothetical protein